MPKRTENKRPLFETLILTIISQNTTDTNSARPFRNLAERFELKPQVLVDARSSELLLFETKSVRQSGLHQESNDLPHQIDKTLRHKEEKFKRNVSKNRNNQTKRVD